MKSWNDIIDLESYEPSNNLLLVDGNNVAYRFINRANYNSFGEEYIRTIKSLAKSYMAKRAIVCFDFGKSYYRMSIYDRYKFNRQKPDDPAEAKKYDEFFSCLNETIEEFPMEHYKFRGIEADDLISFFSMNLKEKYENIWIVSSDRDLYQLLDDNVNIFNMYSRKEINADTLLEENGVTTDEYLLAKIIQGDAGDNIPGVDGIGPKRSEALAREFKTFPDLMLSLPIKRSSQYIKNLNNSKEKLILNEKLISLKKYNEVAIRAGKEGDEYWKKLNESIL
jgi:DNA polymerase-1